MSIFNKTKDKKVEEAQTEEEELNEQESKQQLNQIVFYSFLYSGINPLSDNILEVDVQNSDFLNYLKHTYKQEKIPGYISISENEEITKEIKNDNPGNDCFNCNYLEFIQSQNKQIDWLIYNIVNQTTSIDKDYVIDLLKTFKEKINKGFLLSLDKETFDRSEIVKIVEDVIEIEKYSLSTALTDDVFTLIIYKS